MGIVGMPAAAFAVSVRHHRGVPPEAMDISVVIPAFNAATFVQQQLQAVREQDAEWLDEVIVVDSFSTDETARVVLRFAERFPKVRVVRATLRGANAARNAGIADTSSATVALCDADDVVATGWLAAIREALRECDLVRGNYELNALNSPDVIAARGSVGSAPSDDPSHPVQGLGGNCGFRRSVWRDLGGLREHHYGADDIEFFHRAQIAGYHVCHVEGAVVHYRLRAAMRDLYRQQQLWASSRALLLKEFGPDGPIAPRRLRDAAQSWGWLATHISDARSADPGTRGRWVRVAAQSTGRVKGSLRHRVWYV